jgi:DNA-binding transcriptional MerR regulator
MLVDELLLEARRMLGELGIQQDPQSRVAALPDLRAFRLYRARGLISPPNTKQGVAGVYGRLQLLQLVALKALQSQRHPLREIRSRLSRANEDELEQLIRQPQGDGHDAAKTNRSDSGPTKKDARWIQFQLTEGAFAMVAEEVLSSTHPSELRALGETLAASLLSYRI